MSQRQSPVLSRWYNEVWNENNEEKIYELLAAGSVAHGIGDVPQLTGPEGFTTFFRAFTGEFEGIRTMIDDAIGKENFESAIVTVTATHRQTKKQVNFSGVCMVRTSQGKIAEAWNCFDFDKMNAQLA